MSDETMVPLDFRITESDGTVEVTAWADDRAGIMVMSRISPSKLLIDHVQTFPGFQGRGVGKRLVVAGVEWARANGQMLMPLCPFARQILDRFPEYSDVRTGL
jgi:predicted GNAT family acetyltransferase